MLADRLFHFGLHAPLVSVPPTAQLASLTLSRLRQCLCAVRGHDLLLHFERRRLSLRCAGCGWDSPGWTIQTVMSHPHASDEQLRVGGASTLTPGCVSNDRERGLVDGGVGGAEPLVGQQVDGQP